MRFSPALLSLIPLSTASLDVLSGHGHKTCIVHPLGAYQNDVPNILTAFKRCGHGGKIVFPENETYWIAERLNPHVKDVIMDWKGTWLFSDSLTYWRASSYPITFQNHAAGFVLSGSGIKINGYGSGGINGNGELWYVDEQGTTRPGRPMPFVLWNVSDVHVSNFAIDQPQLWSINIMNGSNLHFENITVTVDDSAAPSGENWAQNTDGFDTMDVTNLTLHNFTFTGGDDCIAIKPRSYNINISNVTCNGGNGIAIGSLGQYLEDSSVENVTISHARVPSTRYGTYIKTWMGELVPQPDSYESDYKPRGGGWGVVRNIVLEDIDVSGAQRAVLVTQDNGAENSSSAKGTSKMEISGVRFVEYSGTLSSSNRVTVDCSKVNPCFDIAFEVWDVLTQDGDKLTGRCKWTTEDGVTGLDGC
ncbi:pectin lyase fold/virulence factor [Aspergillus spinulosporus]